MEVVGSQGSRSVSLVVHSFILVLNPLKVYQPIFGCTMDIDCHHGVITVGPKISDPRQLVQSFVFINPDHLGYFAAKGNTNSFVGRFVPNG